MGLPVLQVTILAVRLWAVFCLCLLISVVASALCRLEVLN